MSWGMLSGLVEKRVLARVLSLFLGVAEFDLFFFVPKILFQVQGIEDAIQELWRRRDEADRD
mgnify:FL=1